MTTVVVHCRRAKYDVYIGRPSKWGNPFQINPRVGRNRTECIQLYREFVERNPWLIEKIKKELKGKILGCWCAPLPCHGDVLAEIAEKNREQPQHP